VRCRGGPLLSYPRRARPLQKKSDKIFFADSTPICRSHPRLLQHGRECRAEVRELSLHQNLVPELLQQGGSSKRIRSSGPARCSLAEDILVRPSTASSEHRRSLRVTLGLGLLRTGIKVLTSGYSTRPSRRVPPPRGREGARRGDVLSPKAATAS